MKTKFAYLVKLIFLLFLISAISSPLYAQRKSKVDKLKERRAREGTVKVDKGLTEALNLAKKGNLNSWKSAKAKIALARDALKKLESSAATRDNADTKKYRADMKNRVKEIYMAADNWLPSKLGNANPREDMYLGGDIEDLRRKVEAQWQKIWPSDEIVAIRFGRDDWKRTVEEGYRDGVKVVVKDVQFLELTVYVKESPNIVTGYPAYVNRDNLAKSENVGVYTKAGDHISHDVPASAF